LIPFRVCTVPRCRAGRRPSGNPLFHLFFSVGGTHKAFVFCPSAPWFFLATFAPVSGPPPVWTDGSVRLGVAPHRVVCPFKSSPTFPDSPLFFAGNSVFSAFSPLCSSPWGQAGPSDLRFGRVRVWVSYNGSFFPSFAFFCSLLGSSVTCLTVF